MAEVADRKITKADIEAKLSDIRGDVDDTATAAKPYLLIAGAVGVAVLLGAAYLLGRRKGKKKTTIVEIRRV
jgi:choline dehydrogenase-like flavoprotein